MTIEKLRRRNSQQHFDSNAGRPLPDCMTYIPEELVGTSLADGRYQLRLLCGQGSMAHVYTAYDCRLETDVIVKIPKPDKMADAGFRQRFCQERSLMVQLSHPHVVRIQDMGEDESLLYVVMQYLSGGDLRQRLRGLISQGGQMAPRSLKSWLREIGQALDFVAAQGMVHRDVKPANILFDDHSNAFLSDFGLTKIVCGDHRDKDSEMTGAGFVVGTPNYVAPEIVLAEDYDGRADQYSLAIIVYHMMSGEPPMQGASSAATMVNQTRLQLPLLNEIRPDVPRGVASAVQKAIQKDPRDRFSSSAEFADAVLEGLSRNSSSSSMARRPARKRVSRRLRTVRQDLTSGSSGGHSGLSTVSEGESLQQWVSKGQKGLVSCPECRVPLPLRPVHSGRTGRCIHCAARLRISKDLTKLYLVHPSAVADCKSGSGSKRSSSSKNGSSGSQELMIGEEIFGLTVPKKIALTLSALLLLITIGSTIYMTMFVTGESEQDRLRQRVNAGKATETSAPAAPSN